MNLNLTMRLAATAKQSPQETPILGMFCCVAGGGLCSSSTPIRDRAAAKHI